MAKYITRSNPVSIVRVKVADAIKDSIEYIDLPVCDLPTNDPARANAVKRELKAKHGADVMLMKIVSVTAGSGFYRMLQTDFIKRAEYVAEAEAEAEVDADSEA